MSVLVCRVLDRPNRVSLAHWRAGIALALALPGCGIDEREFDSNGETTAVDPLGLAGASGAAGSESGTVPDRDGIIAPTSPDSGAGDQTASQLGRGSGADAGSAACVDGSMESCGPPREEGICKFGTRTCSAGIWGECIGAISAGMRDCSSGEDNDCDGQPDNTVDDVCRCTVLSIQACDEHPDLDGKGQCRAGEQVCVAGDGNGTSDFGACSGAVGPGSADSCTVAGDDATCDGTPNGGCSCVEGAVVPCGPETDTGICQRGTSTCLRGAFTTCQGAAFPARRDCSSALDNDCNGVPDNTVDATCTCAVGDTRACGTHPGRDGNGPCRAGQQVCAAGAQNDASSFLACTGSVGPALRDSCTVLGDDADCNGEPNSGCQCVAGQGNARCSGNANASRCNAQGVCVACQANADCSLVSGGRAFCVAGSCVAARCGDGVVSGAEACDDGNTINTDTCTTTCQRPSCGDGFVQPSSGETCDDRNTVSGDGCSKGCVAGRAPRGSSAFASTHLCGVLPNASVGCWGLNTSGQLGSGSIATAASGLVRAATPVSGITDAVEVVVRGNDSCARRRGGTVECWGSNFGARPVPIERVTTATQLAAGMDAFCAALTSGAVSCWTLSTNAQELAGLSNIVQMARGDRHACALRNDGVLLCFGGGTEGELGNGLIVTNAPSVPAPATVFSNVVEVATGYRSTCVRTRNSGFVQCIGSGTTAGSPSALSTGNLQPVTALNLSNAVKIVAGEQHLCALTEDEVVFCWGSGLAAGNGLTAGSPSPFAVSLPGPAIDIGAGSFTSCALLEDTRVFCWGSYAPTTASATPVLIEMP